MDDNSITEVLDKIAADMAEKGIVTPEATFLANSGGRMSVLISGKDFPAEGFHDRTFAVSTASAMRFVKNLPDTKTRHTQEFQAKLAELIDYGNKHDIDAKWLNPITETARELAENAITHVKE